MWKEFYEDWYLFGVEDLMWEVYCLEESVKVELIVVIEEKKDIMGIIVFLLKNMDLN